MNFGIYPDARPLREWKHDWEVPLSRSDAATCIFSNTFADIERDPRRPWRRLGTRFEFECYDVGHLYTLAHFLDRELVKPPLFVQTIFGILGGIGADPDRPDGHAPHRRPAVRRRL